MSKTSNTDILDSTTTLVFSTSINVSTPEEVCAPFALILNKPVLFSLNQFIVLYVIYKKSPGLAFKKVSDAEEIILIIDPLGFSTDIVKPTINGIDN